MKKNSTFIYRIPNHYVGEDCVQLSIPYQDSLTILNDKGVVYHSYYNKSETYINDYLTDERSIKFPYSNIPSYIYSKFGHKITYINQLYDFNKTYLLIGPNYRLITEEYVIKNGNDALLVKNTLRPKDNLSLIGRDDVEAIFKKTNSQENIYYLSVNGGLLSDLNMLLPSEDTINKMRKGLIYPLNNGEPIIIVRVNNGEITIKGYMIDYIKENCYRVNKTDLPVTNYTLSILKGLSCNVLDYHEPRISLLQNPNITIQDIKQAKDKIKQLKLTKHEGNK